MGDLPELVAHLSKEKNLRMKVWSAWQVVPGEIQVAFHCSFSQPFLWQFGPRVGEDP